MKKSRDPLDGFISNHVLEFGKKNLFMIVQDPVLKSKVEDFFIFCVRNHVIIDRLFDDFCQLLSAFCQHFVPP